MKLNFIKRSLTKINLILAGSAILLALAFPKIGFWPLAWVALVPFFLVLDGKTARQSFGLGWKMGFFFFALSFYWLLFVTTPGAICLVMFVALYFGLFALGYWWFSKRGVFTKVFFLSFLWVGIEYTRAHFLTGFGWASLGHSQYQNLWMIQIADIAGMYGVSFLVIAVNLALKEAWVCRREKIFSREHFVTFSLVFALVLTSGLYGLKKLEAPASHKTITVSVVQGNILNERRWHPKGWPIILSDYFELTEEANKDKPDIIIWPESAYPGIWGEEPALAEELKEFTHKLSSPLLVGMITKLGDDYFNTAALFSQQGEITEMYHKLRLVPFGEYIPFRDRFPLLSLIVPIDDFSSGTQYTLFNINKTKGAVLICFEDTVPELAREFVKEGADFFINMTNDAWFGDTRAPYLHLQAAVFRTIENRRPLVRAANTGISAFVDTRGRICKVAKDASGKPTYVKSYATAEIRTSQEKTFYTKYGDVFTWLCFGGILIGIIAQLALYRKQ